MTQIPVSDQIIRVLAFLSMVASLWTSALGITVWYFPVAMLMVWFVSNIFTLSARRP